MRVVNVGISASCANPSVSASWIFVFTLMVPEYTTIDARSDSHGGTLTAPVLMSAQTTVNADADPYSS